MHYAKKNNCNNNNFCNLCDSKLNIKFQFIYVKLFKEDCIECSNDILYDSIYCHCINSNNNYYYKNKITSCVKCDILYN